MIRFRELLREFRNATLRGTVTLYHYTRQDAGEKLTLDPKRGSKQTSSYSRNDYSLSTVPRTFYYTDPSKTERIVRTSHLYSGKVNGSKILDVQDAVTLYQSNSDTLKSLNPNAYAVVQGGMKYGVLNFDELLRTARKFFDGVYYVTGGIPMVALFVPLRVTRKN